tara:strand:- start:208 stop:525 length:318 start_codon:yes stop_codon:yes gene_type:complete
LLDLIDLTLQPIPDKAHLLDLDIHLIFHLFLLLKLLQLLLNVQKLLCVLLVLDKDIGNLLAKRDQVVFVLHHWRAVVIDEKLLLLLDCLLVLLYLLQPLCLLLVV